MGGRIGVWTGLWVATLLIAVGARTAAAEEATTAAQMAGTGMLTGEVLSIDRLAGVLTVGLPGDDPGAEVRVFVVSEETEVSDGIEQLLPEDLVVGDEVTVEYVEDGGVQKASAITLHLTAEEPDEAGGAVPEAPPADLGL